MKSLEKIRQYFKLANDLYQRETGKREEAKLHHKIMLDEIVTLKEHLDLLMEIRILLQEASKEARVQSKLCIEGMVTKALQYVISPSMRFEIELPETEKPQAEFYVISPMGIKDDDLVDLRIKPKEGRGGGVCGVVALALRLALLLTAKPEIQAPLILDEPCYFLSEGYSRSMALFLQDVSKSFNRQIFLSTHNRFLAEIGDKSFLVEKKKKGISSITDMNADGKKEAMPA